MKTFIKILCTGILIATMLLPQIVNAAVGIDDSYRPDNAPDLGVDIETYGDIEDDFGSTAVSIYVQYFAGGLIALTGVLAVFALLNAGFGYATAAGNQEKLNNAKKELVWAALGLVTVILSFFFVQLIFTLMTTLPSS